ncbi:MAG TPA: LysM peptidoglycan-binding domain-containing protein [Rhodospirillaceae bacterium]|nr:LysM peptidoglycan-binding domain-containing protein [Rhodospirillaceae bacterium]
MNEQETGKASEPPPSQARHRPLAVLAIAAVLVAIVAVIGLAFGGKHSVQAEKKAAPPQQQTTVTPEDSPSPSFDLVRINPEGAAVIAGRAMPRAEVVILDGEKEIGRVIADNRGEWVFLTDHPLEPGSRELSLRASNPDGSSRKTDNTVIMVVPERKQSKGNSLAVKVGPDGTVEIMQEPEAAEGAGPISIAGVRYDQQDRLSVSGRATPRATVRIYLEDNPLAMTKADDKGRWQVIPKRALHAGSYHIRADEMGDKETVAARAEIVFFLTGEMPAEGKLTVEPGNSLWRIARHAYGSGFEYLAIYRANKDQIRDPNRIYPGQIFTIPPR